MFKAPMLNPTPWLGAREAMETGRWTLDFQQWSREVHDMRIVAY